MKTFDIVLISLMQGDSVRIFIYSDNLLSRSLFPTFLSFKSIIFLLVLMVPVFGTCLSLVLADKSTQIVFRKRYSRRKNIDESLMEDCMARCRIRLTRPVLPNTQDLLQFKDVETGDQKTNKLEEIKEETPEIQVEMSSSTESSSIDSSTPARVVTDGADNPDMPPSYSGLLWEPANSLPCYKVDVVQTNHIMISIINVSGHHKD